MVAASAGLVEVTPEGRRRPYAQGISGRIYGQLASDGSSDGQSSRDSEKSRARLGEKPNDPAYPASALTEDPVKDKFARVWSNA